MLTFTDLGSQVGGSWNLDPETPDALGTNYSIPNPKPRQSFSRLLRFFTRYLPHLGPLALRVWRFHISIAINYL